jgi:hypothetical protein
MRKLIDLSGKRFGRWRVLALHPKRMRYGKARRAVTALWMCRCDCGTERLVLGSNLRAGYSKSCGCLGREKTRKRNTKHGHARRGKHTRVYDAWQHAKQRCLNPNNKDYGSYGGRDLGIYPDYCDDFLAFFADVLDAPDGLSLDRINNNRGYEPNNMRWADAVTQRRNQRPRKRKRRVSVEEINAYGAALARAASGSGIAP